MGKTEQTIKNSVELIGRIYDINFDHEAYGERFYRGFMYNTRTSGAVDILPIAIPECFLENFCDGDLVFIKGEYRSRNRIDMDKKTHLDLYVFSKEISAVEAGICDYNNIFLDGFVCRKPIYRKTPLGRDIADILVAVNRQRRSAYIPCIAWGRDALYASKINVGDRVVIRGRIQSREYTKKFSEKESESRTAYEVSVSTISVGGKENE